MLIQLPKIIPKGGLEIKNITKYWNLFLSVLSVFMFLGIGVPLFFKVKKFGFFDVLCDKHDQLYLKDPMVIL